jgi:hypothetical protein
MNWPITITEFERLPYRDDIIGDYVYDQKYRARAYPDLIFIFIGTPRRPNWWVFKVDFRA